MALPAIPPQPPLLLTPAGFLNRYQAVFADNVTFNIAEADLRAQARDLADLFLLWSKLGQPLLLSTLDELATVDQRITVVGQAALVANATDSASAASGVEAGEAEFILRRDSTGPLWAYVSVKSSARVRVRWLPVGDPSARPEFLPWLQLEDYPVKAGDAFKYQFEDGQTIPLQARRDLPLPGAGILNPVPTGEADDPNYLPLAPLVSSLPGGAGFSPAALAAAMHPESQLMLDEVEGQVYGSLAAGSIGSDHIRAANVLRRHLETALQQELATATAAVTSQARLIWPNGAPRFYSTLAAANALADYGDTVEAIGTAPVPVLTLKGGVTYATGGRMVNWNLLTDDGLTIITCKVVGNSPEGRYGGGAISVTGAGSDIVVEKALYPNAGTAVSMSAGRLTHSGLLRGDSTNNTVAVLSGTAIFRHVAGPVRLGGSKGFVLSGSAQALIKSDAVIEQSYHRLVDCAGTAKIRIEGGSLFTGLGFALSEIVYMSSGEVTLADGVYDNTSTSAPGAYLTGGTLILDNATIKSIGGTAGTVLLRNGGKVTGAISAQLTVVNENTSGASGPSELHIGSTNGLRVRRIRLTSHITLLSMLLDDNAASVAYQVATFSTGTWTGTADLNALAEAQAALPAAGNAQYATGVALLVKTNPVTPANASNVILSYA
ncbi:hypothetical protein [Hymenobacter yonginensis]|uniref:Uncharacterized protein n=1 Tax=Hymenobacter yonginensis TaxID=748197 RepID=A0ABY7PTL6_9BACT|nr:hypothetical protein [Hymenobacter yonginensis]WBO86262.1 hypothetical protein O9Z63_08365 [Hymenobacter yonginensis]